MQPVRHWVSVSWSWKGMYWRATVMNLENYDKAINRLGVRGCSSCIEFELKFICRPLISACQGYWCVDFAKVWICICWNGRPEVRFFWDNCSKTLFVPPRTALKAVKELNGTFMCGGNVTVGPWSCKLCLACRWRWRNEMMRKERRGSWTSTWGGAIARNGTKSETGAEVGAGVKKGRQDCVPLRHANLIAEFS